MEIKIIHGSPVEFSLDKDELENFYNRIETIQDIAKDYSKILLDREKPRYNIGAFNDDDDMFDDDDFGIDDLDYHDCSICELPMMCPHVFSRSIRRVIFSDPVTVVLWKDGTKTVVKCRKGDTYSKEFGLMACILKYMSGNNYHWFDEVIDKWYNNTKEEK